MSNQEPVTSEKYIPFPFECNKRLAAILIKIWLKFTISIGMTD